MSNIYNYRQITDLGMPNDTAINRTDDLFVFEGMTGDGVMSAESIMNFLPSYLLHDQNPIKPRIVNRTIYRGKYLGNEITSDQKYTIYNGYFTDMYVGDYWTINGISYVIADFNYWSDITKNHIVLIPSAPLYTAPMNNSDSVNGGYASSYMYTTGLTSALTTITNTFGNNLLASHESVISTAITTSNNYTYESSFAYSSVTIELMNDIMVYGHSFFRAMSFHTFVMPIVSSGEQLALFKLRPENIANIGWLRTISGTKFLCVDNAQCMGSANTSLGVRPVFALCPAESPY